MENRSTKKEYVKPQVHRVELSLAEVTLGTGCHNIGINEAARYGPGDGCGTEANGCDLIVGP